MSKEKVSKQKILILFVYVVSFAAFAVENAALTFTFLIIALTLIGFSFSIVSNFFKQNRAIISTSILFLTAAFILDIVSLIGALLSRQEVLNISYGDLEYTQFLIIMFAATLLDFVITLKRGTHEDLSFLNILKTKMAFLVAVVVAEKLISISLPNWYIAILSGMLLPMLALLIQIMIRDFYLQLKN